MKIDFIGFFKNVINKAKLSEGILDNLISVREELEEKLMESTFYDTDEGEGFMTTFSDIEKCENDITLLENSFCLCHDIILAIASNKIDPQELRDFMFNGKSIEDIKNLKYKDTITFNSK